MAPRAVAGADHGLRFGLKRPVDAAARAMELLRGRPIVALSGDSLSGDLIVDFGDGRLLQVFNGSSGHEGWTLAGESGRLLVGLGGGGIAIWNGSSVSRR